MLNARHHLLIVATQLDPSTSRIVNYLADLHGVSINAIFFQVFVDGDREYLGRVWMKDPYRVDSPRAPRSGAPEIAAEWNREFYVNFGVHSARSWEDARRYGFIGAAGGRTYTATLSNLSVGDRIWVKTAGDIPHKGYVGVGLVTQEAVPLSEFQVQQGGTLKSIRECEMEADTELAVRDGEVVVGVDWIHTVPISEQVWRKGFFFQRHPTVVKPRKSNWLKTLSELVTAWGLSDQIQLQES